MPVGLEDPLAGAARILRAGRGLMAAGPPSVSAGQRAGLLEPRDARPQPGHQRGAWPREPTLAALEPLSPPPSRGPARVASVSLFFPGDPRDHRRDEGLPRARGPQVGPGARPPTPRPPRPGARCPAHHRLPRLQRHHPGEHSHRQPRGAQQPLHPHRPPEQLLSPGLASSTPAPRLRCGPRRQRASGPRLCWVEGQKSSQEVWGLRRGGDPSPTHTPLQ